MSNGDPENGLKVTTIFVKIQYFQGVSAADNLSNFRKIERNKIKWHGLTQPGLIYMRATIEIKFSFWILEDLN